MEVGLQSSSRASTLTEELGATPKLMDERLGHVHGSVQARYSHVTPGMRGQLLAGLTQLWEASLNARAGISPALPSVSPRRAAEGARDP